MSSPPPWKDCQVALERVLEMTQSTLQAATDAVSSGQADAYASSCAQLAKALTTLQPALSHVLRQGSPPTELQGLMQRIDGDLQALQALTTRQEAAARRALGVLFPADQVREYSRLGSRLGAYGAGTRPAGSGYLKA